MRISVDAEKCTGCRICELVCSHTKLKVFGPEHARIKVVNLDYWGFSNPVLCIQCKKPVCVEVCPVQALSQTADGTILLDEGNCNGCGICVEECHIGAIRWHKERALPMICDLCGGKPVCTEWCPAGVLTFKSQAISQPKIRGTKALKYSVGKGKRSLSKLNVPKDVFGWYDRFIQGPDSKAQKPGKTIDNPV